MLNLNMKDLKESCWFYLSNSLYLNSTYRVSENNILFITTLYYKQRVIICVTLCTYHIYHLYDARKTIILSSLVFTFYVSLEIQLVFLF